MILTGIHLGVSSFEFIMNSPGRFMILTEKFKNCRGGYFGDNFCFLKITTTTTMLCLLWAVLSSATKEWNANGTWSSVSGGTCCSLSLPCYRPRLVGQATLGAVLKKFSAPQPMPALRALWLAPDFLRVKKSFNARQKASLRDLPRPWFLDLPQQPTCATKFCGSWKTASLALCWRKVSSLYLHFGYAILSSGILYAIGTTCQ